MEDSHSLIVRCGNYMDRTVGFDSPYDGHATKKRARQKNDGKKFLYIPNQALMGKKVKLSAEF